MPNLINYLREIAPPRRGLVHKLLVINLSIAPPFKAGFEKEPTPFPQNLGNLVNLKTKFPKF